mmetsp:Transcript_23449/g.36696  ORF Transcript_23449/g.36696 Transcript_23449/m.36696 type:complete len:313 (+) Transcript_23449:226-1164(+)
MMNSYHLATCEDATYYLDEIWTAFAFLLARLELTIGPCHELTFDAPIQLRKAIESRQSLTFCLEAYVQYFKPQLRRTTRSENIEALSILKSLILHEEDEGHHTSIPFLFHPDLVYSLPTILKEKNKLTPRSVHMFFCNQTFRKLLQDAANHMVSIKCAVQEIIVMSGAWTDNATNSIQYKRRDGGLISAPFYSSDSKPSNLEVVLEMKDPPTTRDGWIKIFERKYPDVPSGRNTTSYAQEIPWRVPGTKKRRLESESTPAEARLLLEHKEKEFHSSSDEIDDREAKWNSEDDKMWGPQGFFFRINYEPYHCK